MIRRGKDGCGGRGDDYSLDGWGVGVDGFEDPGGAVDCWTEAVLDWVGEAGRLAWRGGVDYSRELLVLLEDVVPDSFLADVWDYHVRDAGDEGLVDGSEEALAFFFGTDGGHYVVSVSV